MIRLVLFLLLIQFAAPAYAHVGTTDNSIQEKNSYKSQQEAGITLSVFLKEFSEEKNEEQGKAHASLKLIDFTSREVALTQIHSQILLDHSSAQSASKPLFKLFSVYLI